MCALVVVKWKFIGTTSPGLTKAMAMMFSQARPWCAGSRNFVPNISCTLFSSRVKDALPA